MITHKIEHIESTLQNKWTFVLLDSIKEHPGENRTFHLGLNEDKTNSRSRFVQIQNLIDIGLVKDIPDTGSWESKLYLTKSGEYTLESYRKMVVEIHLKNRAGINDQ